MKTDLKNLGGTPFVPDPVIFSQRMIKLRKEKGMTQKDLTQYLGKVVTDTSPISFTTVSSWETGKRTPRIPMLMALAELYDVSINYLIGTSSERGHFYPDEQIFKRPSNSFLIEKKDLPKFDQLPVYVTFPDNRPGPLWGIYDAASDAVFFPRRLLENPIEKGCNIYSSALTGEQ